MNSDGTNMAQIKYEKYTEVFVQRTPEKQNIQYNKNVDSKGFWRRCITLRILDWLRLTLSMGPNRVGISPLIWGQEQTWFPKRVL
jgi:hypothetical protein